MSKKIMLLAFAVAGAAMFALPATAVAVEEDVPLHVVPKPASATPVTGGKAMLSTVIAEGIRIECLEVKGSASWESSTTGTLQLTFAGCAGKEKLGNTVTCTSLGQAAGSILTKVLPFHLLTVPTKSPGMLVTPDANGVFATFECIGGLIHWVWELKGNGLIGTITSPACGSESSKATIAFENVAVGVQKHKKVEGTTAEYFPTSSINGATGESAVAMADTVSFPTSTRLECT